MNQNFSCFHFCLSDKLHVLQENAGALIKVKDLFDIQGCITKLTVPQFEMLHKCNQIFISKTLQH